MRVQKGDLKRVLKTINTIAKPGSGALRAAKAAALEEVESLTDLGFVGGKDPHGAPWLRLKNPSKKRGGESSVPLSDTGQLRASFHGTWGNRRLIFSSDKTYASPHQTGTSRIPRRQMLPDGDEWTQDITEAVVQAVVGYINRKLK